MYYISAILGGFFYLSYRVDAVHSRGCFQFNSDNGFRWCLRALCPIERRRRQFLGASSGHGHLLSAAQPLM